MGDGSWHWSALAWRVHLLTACCASPLQGIDFDAISNVRLFHHLGTPFARRNLEALPCEQFNRVLFMTQIPRQDPAIDTKVLLGALFFKDIVKRRSGGEQIRRDNIVNELWDSISLDAAGTDYVQIGKLDAAALAQVGLKSGVQ
jgi:hypothetical protein